MSNKLAVSTSQKCEDGSVKYHSIPESPEECEFILVSNGWNQSDAEQAISELLANPGEDYIVVNELCQIC